MVLESHWFCDLLYYCEMIMPCIGAFQLMYGDLREELIMYHFPHSRKQYMLRICFSA